MAKRIEVCRFDKVARQDIPQCTWQSFVDLHQKLLIRSEQDWKAALVEEDRVYYVIVALLLAIVFATLLQRILH